MNNFSTKLKKALTNKNFVTAIAFLLIGVVLIVGYNLRLNAATTPIRVPYAKQTIQAQTKITSDMIGMMSIASDAVNRDLIYTDASKIVDLYTNIESTIYEGSFFYKAALSTKDNMPTSALLDVPTGHTLLSLKTNMVDSYYNSLVPGDYFDLYVRTIGILPGEKNKENEIMVGKLIDKIRILAVKTEDGLNVFGSDEARIPAGLIFSLPEDQALLMMKAEYFEKLSGVASIEFVVIPRGQTYKPQNEDEKVESTVTSEELEEYINDKTKEIDIKTIKDNSNLDE